MMQDAAIALDSASLDDPIGAREATSQLTLDALDVGVRARVVDVVAPDAGEWERWLQEIGFVPGEPLMLTTRGVGGDPLVVRIGASTFALRRAEAACVRVQRAS